MTGHPYTKVREAIIASKGNTAAAGRSLGVSRQTIHFRLSEAGDDELIRKYPQPTDDEIRAAFEKGGSLRDIGKRLGVSKQSASRYAQTFAPERVPAPRPLTPLNPALLAEIQACHAMGWSLTRMARALRISRGKVARHLQQTALK